MHKLYGSKISYFSGKLEAYLRYKEVPFEFIPMGTRAIQKIMAEQTGTTQLPALQLADGRWLTDTTPIIEWLESRETSHVIPSDPEQAFFCRLLEDYGDEWLWRPAMHYRWSYKGDKDLLRRKIVDELMSEVPLPHWLKLRLISYRQHHYFVKKDGVNSLTWDHVEQAYLRALSWLQKQLQDQPFILGSHPTLADFGMYGSMFRHFGSDPTAVEIMRERAPAVYAWVARMWNAKQSDCPDELVTGIPSSWDEILLEVGQCHLENLHANAVAWGRQEKTYDVCLQGTQYQKLPVSQYRVWCLQQLRRQFELLSESVKPKIEQTMRRNQCWEPLWRMEDPCSNYDEEGLSPFNKGIKVYSYKGI